MKANNISIIAVILAIFFTGCIKSDLHECPVNPESTTVTVTTDWSNIGENIDIPSDYTVKLNSYLNILSGITNTLDHPFNPGTHNLHIYNDTDNITVADNQASVATIDAPTGGTGLFISPIPGWFFSSMTEVEIEEGRNHNFTASMTQHVGEITLILEPTGENADNIISITGWLSGMASTFNMENNQEGDPANIPVVFTKDPADGKWKATIRTFGTVGPEQILTAMIDFSGNIPSQRIESDMSEALEGFNENKTNFPPLEGDIIETPTGNSFTAIINGWRPGNGSGGNETAN